MPEGKVEIEVEDEEIAYLLDKMLVNEKPKTDTVVKYIKNGRLDQNCKLDFTYKLRTKKCSALGKVVCRQWKLLKTPDIKREKLNTKVVPFDFLTPSPDVLNAKPYKIRPAYFH